MNTCNEDQPFRYVFDTPDRIPDDILRRIHALIVKGGGVGTSWIWDNLANAYLIAYAATTHGKVVGTVVHKVPKEAYRQKIENLTGLDLAGALERGYTSVDPSCRDRHVADTLISGLIQRSRGKKIYVTIRLDNGPALALTRNAGMVLAGEFTHEKTRQRIGVFTNWHPEKKKLECGG